MVERIDDHVLLDDDAEAAQAGREARLEHEAEVVGKEGGAAAGKVRGQRLTLAGQIRRPGVEVDDGRAVRRDGR